MTVSVKLRSSYFFVVMGMIVVSQGALMTPMLDRFALSYSEGGILVASNAAMFLITGLLAGFAVDRFSHRIVVFSGYVAFTLSMAALSFAPDRTWLIVGWALCGVGWGLSNSALNTMISDLTAGDSRILSFLHMLFGVGAFVIPLLVRALLGTRFGFVGATAVLGVLAAGGAALAWRLPRETRVAAPPQGRGKLGWSWILFAALLFFYVGTESSFNNWSISALIGAKSFSEPDAQVMLSVFWIAMIAGRFLVSLLPRRTDVGALLLGMSIASIASLVVFMLAVNSTLIVASVIIFGLSCSAVYPLTIASSSRFTRGSGLASALVISGGGLGAALLPLLTGVIADISGVFSIWIVMILSASLMTGLASICRRFAAASAVLPAPPVPPGETARIDTPPGASAPPEMPAPSDSAPPFGAAAPGSDSSPAAGDSSDPDRGA